MSSHTARSIRWPAQTPTSPPDGPSSSRILFSFAHILSAVFQAGRTTHEAGLVTVPEGFIDRAYKPNGSLVDRTQPGALASHPSSAARQALQLPAGSVDTIDGSALSLHVSTLCIHGETPGAADIAQAVRSALTDAGYLISFALSGKSALYKYAIAPMGERALLVSFANRICTPINEHVHRRLSESSVPPCLGSRTSSRRVQVSS